MNYLTIEQIDAYEVSFELSNYVWKIVVKWDYFAKKAMGHQYVSAIDSISANLAEGWGRYYKKEKIQFYRYNFGSLKESEDWTRKAIQRELISTEESQFIQERLQKLPQLINQLIQYTNTKLKY